MNKVNILGVNVDKVTFGEAVDKIYKMLNEKGNHAVFTPNSEIILKAYKDEAFCEILNSADLLTADGIGVVYASKIVKNPVPERVAGYDMACGIIEKIAESGHRLYLFGGKPGVAETAQEKLKEKYPLLNIVGTRKGYFTPDEVDSIIEDINQSGADLVPFRRAAGEPVRGGQARQGRGGSQCPPLPATEKAPQRSARRQRCPRSAPLHPSSPDTVR